MQNNIIQTTTETKIEKALQIFEGERNLTEQDKKQLRTYITGLNVLGVIGQLESTQIYHFLRICWDLKLDPIKKEIYAIPFGGKLSIVISYLEYLKNAENDPRYQAPSITTITTDANGNPLPFGDVHCIFEGKRKGEETTFRKVFYMREWNKKQGEWGVKPLHMLEKTALKNGLTWLYPKATMKFTQAEETIIADTGEVLNDEENISYKVEVPKKVQAPKPKKTKDIMEAVATQEIIPKAVELAPIGEQQEPTIDEDKRKDILDCYLALGHSQEVIEKAMIGLDWTLNKGEMFAFVGKQIDIIESELPKNE